MKLKYDIIMWDWVGTLLIDNKLNPKIPAQIFTSNKNVIVSNCDDKGIILEWCKKMQLNLPEKAIICRNSGIKKPNPMMYYELCKQMEFEAYPNKKIFIGDSDVDYLFAKNINSEFIHIDNFTIDFLILK